MRQVFYIDLDNVNTKEELYERIAKELPLPEYYGKNLDALYDFFTDGAGEMTVIFYNLEKAGDGLLEYIKKLKKMTRAALSEMGDSLDIRYYQ